MKNTKNHQPSRVPRIPAFDFSGGAPCLAFANTAADRLSHERKDTLHRYEDLLSWLSQAGLMSARERRDVGEQARAHADKAEQAFQLALNTRELIYRVFSCVASEKRPDPSDLSELNSLWLSALVQLRLEESKTQFRLTFSGQWTLNHPLHNLVLSAVELLMSSAVHLVRRCASQTCDWLFLDESKNQSRRWCDMQICGSRAKARRYYTKTRAE